MVTLVKNASISLYWYTKINLQRRKHSKLLNGESINKGLNK